VSTAALLCVALALAACTRLRVRVQLDSFEGTVPETVRVSCFAEGGRGALDYAWQLGPGVRVLGGPPRGRAAMVSVLSPHAPTFVECTVTDGAHASRSAVARIGPVTIRAVLPSARQAGAPLTLEGAGFQTRGPDDAVYLVPAGGTPTAADSTCPKAAWSDGRVVVCLPAGTR
jgi:hypothetical protein